MANLVTVPNFIFEQGDIFNQESNAERPIQVQYYNGSICLEQNGNEILIIPEYLDRMFKEIKKHQKAAQIHFK